MTQVYIYEIDNKNGGLDVVTVSYERNSKISKWCVTKTRDGRDLCEPKGFRTKEEAIGCAQRLAHGAWPRLAASTIDRKVYHAC